MITFEKFFAGTPKMWEKTGPDAAIRGYIEMLARLVAASANDVGLFCRAIASAEQALRRLHVVKARASGHAKEAYIAFTRLLAAGAPLKKHLPTAIWRNVRNAISVEVDACASATTPEGVVFRVFRPNCSRRWYLYCKVDGREESSLFYVAAPAIRAGRLKVKLLQASDEPKDLYYECVWAPPVPRRIYYRWTVRITHRAVPYIYFSLVREVPRKWKAPPEAKQQAGWIFYPAESRPLECEVREAVFYSNEGCRVIRPEPSACFRNRDYTRWAFQVVPGEVVIEHCGWPLQHPPVHLNVAGGWLVAERIPGTVNYRPRTYPFEG